MSTTNDETLIATLADAFGPESLLLNEVRGLIVKARLYDDLMYARKAASKDADDTEWKALVRRGRLIGAIKSCRTLHGLSLLEAKDCVDSYAHSK